MNSAMIMAKKFYNYKDIEQMVKRFGDWGVLSYIKIENGWAYIRDAKKSIKVKHSYGFDTNNEWVLLTEFFSDEGISNWETYDDDHVMNALVSDSGNYAPYITLPYFSTKLTAHQTKKLTKTNAAKETRHYLRGALFDFKENMVVATDGHRMVVCDVVYLGKKLGQATRHIINPGWEQGRPIVPVLTIGEMAKTGHNMIVNIGENADRGGMWVNLTTPILEITIQCLSAIFPNVKKLIADMKENTIAATITNMDMFKHMLTSYRGQDAVSLSIGCDGLRFAHNDSGIYITEVVGTCAIYPEDAFSLTNNNNVMNIDLGLVLGYCEIFVNRKYLVDAIFPVSKHTTNIDLYLGETVIHVRDPILGVNVFVMPRRK